MPLVLDPISLSDADQRVVSGILRRQHEDALIARKQMEEAWIADLRSYEGRPRVERKSFPWPGCANTEIPIKAIHTDVIQANLHRAIYGQDKLFRALTEDDRPEIQEDARLLEDFINFECRNRIQLRHTTPMWMWESILLGTGFAKGAWLDLRRIQYVSRGDEDPRPQEIFDHYGPMLDPMCIEDCITPSNAQAINGPFRCEWITHATNLRWDEILQREDQGYQNLDRIEGHEHTSHGREIKDERDRLEAKSELRRDTGFDIFETWHTFPVHELARYPHRTVQTADGPVERKYVDLVITWHYQSGTILRVIENWNEIGWRPFFVLPYMRRKGSLYGQGVGRATHYLVESLTTNMNQHIDNFTVANTRVWGARKNAGIERGAQIVPSKLFFMDNPREDLVPIQMGDVYTGSQANIASQLKHYIELRTGVNDYQAGREAQGQYQATATSTLKLIQQGNQKWDFTIDDWRETFGQLAQWLVSQYRQYGYHYTGILERQFGPEKAARIREALDRQSDQPTFALYKFDLVVTSAQLSKDAEIQKNQVLFDLLERYYLQVMGLLGMLGRGFDENGVPITESQKVLIEEAVTAGFALMKRLLHEFDVKDTESFLPNLERLAQAKEMDDAALAAQRAQGAMGAVGDRGPEAASAGEGAPAKPNGAGVPVPPAGPPSAGPTTIQ